MHTNIAWFAIKPRYKANASSASARSILGSFILIELLVIALFSSDLLHESHNSYFIILSIPLGNQEIIRLVEDGASWEGVKARTLLLMLHIAPLPSHYALWLRKRSGVAGGPVTWLSSWHTTEKCTTHTHTHLHLNCGKSLESTNIHSSVLFLSPVTPHRV